MIDPCQIGRVPRQMQHHLILDFRPLLGALDLGLPLLERQVPELIRRQAEFGRIYETLVPVSSLAG